MTAESFFYLTYLLEIFITYLLEIIKVATLPSMDGKVATFCGLCCHLKMWH